MDASTGIPLGRYLLGEKLASGGMGEVFVAVQRGLEGFEKPLAIKLLLPHLAEESHVVKMFLDEARLCARMSHPNIVQILDLGLEDERYFLAMELVWGVSLVRLVRVLAAQQRTLSAPLILHVARALLDALHYAHTLTGADGKPLGLIHRDVTPHNILVSINGEVKLTDFGIAKVQAAVGQTRPGVVRGKMDYLAPEQLRFERLDSRVDQFAAGLTLFFLATGRSPFVRGTTQESLQAIQHDPLPMLDTLRPDLPRELVSAITRATEKDPHRRFASARAFRDALPPPSAEERAELLGALVREVCPSVVGTLDRASRTFAALNANPSRAGGTGRQGTQSLSRQTLDAHVLTAPSQPGEAHPGTPSLSAEPHPGTLPPPGEPRSGTVPETVLPVGTVAAPQMAELEQPRGDAAPYVPRPLEQKGDGTVPMDAPPSRRTRRWIAMAITVGVLTVVGLGVGWILLFGSAEGSRPVGPDSSQGTQPLQDGSGSTGSGAGLGEPDGGKDGGGQAVLSDAGAVSSEPSDAGASPSEPMDAGVVNSTLDAGDAGGKPPLSVDEEVSAQPRRRGLLTVDANPWGQVFIGGKQVGMTPMARYSVPVGDLDVEMRNPETGKSARVRVKVQAGKEHRVKVDLR
ncbi:serine/threonine-protein kinase [Hyalangium versicolor]|uniref:serine/threonine-protein kinase n=1 Tax=Hyalangium versicolor TaxID=2861190 RepID=UPI001CCCB82B|nr:serine/threonine-protein kinase [Hyalangium versicolor]